MIKPTVGRMVLFRRGKDEPEQAAIVAYVHSDRKVNLATFSHNGLNVPEVSVVLVQEGEDAPSAGCFCEWMPYQKAVASGAIPPTLHKA